MKDIEVCESVSCSATVSNMSVMLTLIMKRVCSLYKLRTGGPVCDFTCILSKKKTSAPQDYFKVKHKEEYCSYRLRTNFSITFLEDVRGRGELNVKGDKGKKIVFSTKCQSLRI